MAITSYDSGGIAVADRRTEALRARLDQVSAELAGMPTGVDRTNKEFEKRTLEAELTRRVAGTPSRPWPSRPWPSPAARQPTCSRPENSGKDRLDVMSHVAAQENHLDWYTLQLRDASGAIRTLKLLGPRRESGPVKVELKPGARVEHSIDLTTWAEPPINGGKPLAAGTWDAPQPTPTVAFRP